MLRRTAALSLTLILGLIGAAPAAAGSAGPPRVVGALDTLTTDGLTVTLSGWATVPGSSEPVEIHVYDQGPNGTQGYSGFLTSRVRPDVAAVYGGSSSTGYSITLPVSIGTRQICAFGIGATSNTLLGCRTISTPPPFGVIDTVPDVVSADDPVARIAGWAVDPGRPDVPLPVHIYDRGPDGGVVGTAFTSTVDRPDVAEAFRTGTTQGFSVSLILSPAIGLHEVCVFAISATQGVNSLLGCRDILVRPSVLGALDSVVPIAAGVVRVSGWIVDPTDPTGTAQVRFRGTPFGGVQIADQLRPDVAVAHPAAGPAHGFGGSETVGPGSSRVCAVRYDPADGGTGDEIGCRTITMTNAVGSIDAATSSGGTVTVTGWTIDPYAPGASGTPVILEAVSDSGSGGGPVVVEADATADRPDVNRTFSVSGTHGFTADFGAGRLAAGSYTVRAYAPALFEIAQDDPAQDHPFATVRVSVG